MPSPRPLSGPQSAALHTQPSTRGVGTGWAERIAPDEAQRHAAGAAALREIQRAKSARYGQGRALHRKPLLALKGTLRVRADVPAYAAHGLFAAPAAYETWVRLSNGGPDVRRDRTPDIRGLALRVQGVQGESALGGAASHQDFTLINQKAFAFPDSRPFFGLVIGASKGPLGLLGWALKTYGPLGMLGALKKLKSNVERAWSGYATEPFYSAAPIACGPAAVRVRLLPPAGQLSDPQASQDWGADVARRLAAGPLVWRLQLQFFVDEAQTPIEDASVDWPESISPYIDVAELEVAAPEAGTGTGTAFAEAVERAVFDPWAALLAHRPLGEVMRARKQAYYASQQERAAAG
jgi:hypothetical protein